MQSFFYLELECSASLINLHWRRQFFSMSVFFAMFNLLENFHRTFTKTITELNGWLEFSASILFSNRTLNRSVGFLWLMTLTRARQRTTRPFFLGSPLHRTFHQVSISKRNDWNFWAMQRNKKILKYRVDEAVELWVVYSMVSQLIRQAILLIPGNTMQIKEYSHGIVIAFKQFIFYPRRSASSRHMRVFPQAKGVPSITPWNWSCIYRNFYFVVFNSKPRCCHKIMFEKNIILFSAKLFTKYQCQNNNVFALIRF